MLPHPFVAFAALQLVVVGVFGAITVIFGVVILVVIVVVISVVAIIFVLTFGVFVIIFVVVVVLHKLIRHPVHIFRVHAPTNFPFAIAFAFIRLFGRRMRSLCA